MLECGDIVLRPISINDTEFVMKLRNDFETTLNFVSDYPTYDFEHIKWLNNHEKDIDMIIIYKGDKAGRIRVTNLDYRNQKGEYAIEISKKFRGKGIGTKSSCLLLDYVFFYLPIQKVYLKVFEDNVPAIKLYEKLGFEIEGRLKREVYKKGRWKTLILMALFNERWKEVRKNVCKECKNAVV